MSYDISYRRQAFRMTAAQAGHYDDLVFLIEEAGSSNCWELCSRRRARSWMCLAAGALWECLAEVTRSAAACCGGSLVLYGRRRTAPEAYIRAWRRAAANAAPIEEAGRLGFRIALFTRISEQDAVDGRKYAFDKLTSQSLVVPGRHTDPQGKTSMEWRFDILVPEQVKLWLETRNTGRSVEADGPDR